MGGTGKTPILFELLSAMNPAETAVISRGYKSPWERSFYLLRGNKQHPQKLTDEALLLNKKFPLISIFLGKNRHHSAIIAEKLFKYKHIFLDDGFQYRRLYKDIEIILWDATTDITNAQLLPKGNLREPITRLKDATVILLTRCEMVNNDKITIWKNWLTKHSANKPIIEMKTIVEGFVDAHSAPKKPSKNCYAFAAIGNPESFFKQLEKQDLNLVNKKIFPDHYRFSENDIKNLLKKASDAGASLICTEKDIVKIPTDISIKNNILAMKIRTIPVSETPLKKELANLNILF